MRVVTTLRNLSLGMAAASFLFVGAAFASSPEMAGGVARLDHTINAKDAHVGQQVEARLNGKIKTNSGINLPKGTELMGKVSRVQASENGGPSRLSLVFTQAQMKDGKTIPVKVMLVGAFPASAGGEYGAGYGQDIMGPTPKHIGPHQKIDQESGLLGNTSMVASAQGRNSATFRDKKGDVNLKAGTFFQIGVAPASSGNQPMQSGT